MAARIVLTRREKDVLELVARRLTNGEIGERLGVRSDTVKFHLQSVFVKLGVTTRHEAAALLGRTIRKRAASNPSGNSRPKSNPGRPTPRELEAASLRAENLSNAQVAIRMGVRRDTAKRWARLARRKTTST